MIRCCHFYQLKYSSTIQGVQVKVEARACEGRLISDIISRREARRKPSVVFETTIREADRESNCPFRDETCGPIGSGILLADASKIERDSRCTKEVRLMLWDVKIRWLGYGMLGLYSPLQRLIAYPSVDTLGRTGERHAPLLNSVSQLQLPV